MAFTEEQINKMRANSIAGAEKQKQREQLALEKYMTERELRMKKTMTTKERNAAVRAAIAEGKSAEYVAQAFEMTVERVRKIAGLPAEEKPAEQTAEPTAEPTAEITAERAAQPVQDEVIADAVEEICALGAADEVDADKLYVAAVRISRVLRAITQDMDFSLSVKTDETFHILELDADGASATLMWRRKENQA